MNKYYIKHIPTDSNKWSYTDVKYRSYKLLNTNLLEVKLYDAGMKLEYDRQFEFIKNKVLLVKENGFFPFDTSVTNVLDPVYYDWEESGQTFRSEGWHENSERVIKRKFVQTDMRDTTFENFKGVSFLSELEYEVIFDQDTSTMEYEREIYFAEGLGFWGGVFKNEDWTLETILVEQISYDAFVKASNHGKNRIAYIDPSKTLDDHSLFRLCDNEKYIVDYYNGDPAAGIIGGKRSIQKLLDERLDRQKLKSESGYLTYRFVINCQGEAGRFITEETDLDFNAKEFDRETVEHLYTIIRQLEKYRPTKLKYKEVSDAYFYLTFKLRDGEIIDLLP